MSIAILDAATFGEVRLDAITDIDSHHTIYPYTPQISLPQRLQNVQIAVTNKVVIDEIAMDEAPNLELICIAATGTNNVDLEAARVRNIAVTNVPGYAVPSVVSHTFAMYFHLAHHNAYHDQYTRLGNWCRSPIFSHLAQPFSELAGKVWGIIGMGAIGRGVAKVAEGFGCQVVYHSTSGRNTSQPYQHLSLDELLAKADVVSIHAPLNERTKNLITRHKILLMKPQAILINNGRGGIIHEGDLAVALDLGVIAGAGLDVMEQEPPQPDHPFWKMEHPERLFVTPHIGGLSLEARNRLVAEIGANIRAFLQGESRNRAV